MWDSMFKIKFLIYEYFHISSQWKNELRHQTECPLSVMGTIRQG